MKKGVLVFSGILILLCSNAAAAELPPKDADIIKSAGISIHPDVTFVIGSRDVGYRFATLKSPDEVRQWYRDKLPEWSLYEEFGGWILYLGKQGLGMGEIMSKPQIMIQANDKLPEWHSLDKDMTTELVIMIPESE